MRGCIGRLTGVLAESAEIVGACLFGHSRRSRLASSRRFPEDTATERRGYRLSATAAALLRPQTPLPIPNRGRCAAVHGKFFENIFDVFLDCARRNLFAIGDVGVALIISHERQDLFFADRQRLCRLVAAFVVVLDALMNWLRSFRFVRRNFSGFMRGERLFGWPGFASCFLPAHDARKFQPQRATASIRPQP